MRICVADKGYRELPNTDMAADEVLLIADHDGCHFEIQEGHGEGFYVWRFVGDSDRSTHDYLQDDIPMAKRCAFHQFGVPEDAWRVPASQNDSRLGRVHHKERTEAVRKRSWLQRLFGHGTGR